MILWALLILTFTSGTITLALVQANAKVSAEVAASAKRHGISGSPAGCLGEALTLAWLGCWIAYAIQVDDWRFGAIAAVGWIMKMTARAVTNVLARKDANR